MIGPLVFASGFINTIIAKQFGFNLPFGETFVEQQIQGKYENPYKFNAKELDSETGFYYYGARYYNPRLSIWYGIDPLAEKMPSWSPYAYSFNNPVRYTDPDGRKPLDWYQDQRTGNYKWFDGSGSIAGYSHLDGSGTTNIPILQKTPDGNPHWGVTLNQDGTVTDWINRENIAMDGRTFKTPDGIYYTSGSRETRLEYEHQTLRTVADVLEWTSIGLEVAGATTAIPTAGTGGVVLAAGEAVGIASTVLNIGLDVREGKYGSATARAALFVLTAGLGNGISKLTNTIEEKTAGVVIKTANDKVLDTARDQAVQRAREKEANMQRISEAIRLEKFK